MVGLPLALHLALLIAGPLIGFVIARRLHRGGATLSTGLQRARWLWAVLPALAALLAAHFVLQDRPDIWWLLPPWLEVRYMAVLWGCILLIFGLLFGVVVTLAHIERHAEWHKALAAAALCVVAVEIAHFHHTRPLDEELQPRETADGVVLQSTAVSCAAASLANWRRLEGHPATEREMADVLGTTTLGTTAGQVIIALERFGRMCRKAELTAGGLSGPSMLFVDDPGVGQDAHAVLHVRRDGELHEVWDPAVGRLMFTRPQLETLWGGRAIVCN